MCHGLQLCGQHGHVLAGTAGHHVSPSFFLFVTDCDVLLCRHDISWFVEFATDADVTICADVKIENNCLVWMLVFSLFAEIGV